MTSAGPFAAGQEDAAEGRGRRRYVRRRSVWFVVSMSIVTFGIYHLYWIYTSFADVRRTRGKGLGGLIGLLFSLVVVGEFVLPAYVGRMYREEGWDDPPVSGWTGLWALFPFVGAIILMGVVQSAVNRFCDSSTAG